MGGSESKNEQTAMKTHNAVATTGNILLGIATLGIAPAVTAIANVTYKCNRCGYSRTMGPFDGVMGAACGAGGKKMQCQECWSTKGGWMVYNGHGS